MLRLFRSRAASARPVAPPSLGAGRRAYAIGDVHGRLDLLRQLIDQIAEDDLARGPVERTTLILLGDYIDRGPDSAGVLDFVMRLGDWWPDSICLQGNHEEVFLMAARGDESALRFLTRIGGRETLLSYGASEADLDTMTLGQLCDWLTSHIPEAHLAFIETMAEKVVIGDYLFVHAGIRPRVPLEEQETRDLRWIRDEFLTSNAAHDHFVIHGHSIAADVEERPNRIGIDTGAYASGILTAVGLEGTERWFMNTAEED